MVLATATKIAGKALVKKLADTPYVAAMKKLAKIQHKLSRKEKLERLLDIKNTKRLAQGRGVRDEFSLDDTISIKRSKGHDPIKIKRGEADPIITVLEGKGYKGADLPNINWALPFEKTEIGRRKFLESQADKLKKGIVAHYKKNKKRFGFKTNAEAEQWALDRLKYTPMPTYQRWARMQHGPVAKREFGHDILYPHSKDTKGYSTSGIGNLKYEKFGKVTEGTGGRFKTFKERRIERELENFLRQPTGRGDGTINADVLNSTDIAAIPKFQGYAPDIGTASHKIDKFRSEKELKKITHQIRNIFGLTPSRAKAYEKTDPMLSEIYEMGKGLGSLRGKKGGLRDMIYRHSDPSRQSFFDTPFQQSRSKSGGLYPWLHRLHDRFTPYNPGIPPKAVSLQHRNMVHKTAEQRLRDLDDLVERKLGNEKQIKEWKTEMKEIGEDMELLGLQSDINDITYGKWYADPADKIWKQMMPLFKSMKKEFPLKRLKMMNPQGKVEKYKYKGFDEGGVIDHFQAGGLVGLGSRILRKLAKKLSRQELKMMMGQ